MRQALRSLAIVAALLAPISAAAAPAEPIAQARLKIAAKDLKGAASLLEEALGSSPAPSAEDRKALVDLLKETYRGLIRDAKAAGNSKAAAAFEDDLAILEVAAPATAVVSAAPAPVVTAPAPAVTAPVRSLPPIPAPAASPNVAAEASPKAPPAEPETRPIPRVDPPSDPLADQAADLPALGGPASPSERHAVAPSARTRDDRVGRASASAAAPEPVDTPTPAAPAARDELAEADALFNTKKYEQAGKSYAALARQGKLPETRSKAWAYCRWAAIVTRINAGPKTKQEWEQLDREVDSVQKLTPGNWFGDYLKDLVAEGRSGRRPVAKGPGVSVRGASPDEPETDAATPTPRKPRVDPQARKAAAQELQLPVATDDLPAPAPVPATPVEELSPAAQAAPAQEAASPVSWQVLETASFRIFHNDAKLAARAAEAAEAVRASQGARWGSPAARTAWSPRCDLYLYPTPADFAKMTGQPETSPGFSTMGIGGGRVVARRVNLRANHPQLISAILPHEVTHVVLADVFTDLQIPRWADEGMAVLAEPVAEQVGRAVELNAPLAQGRVFGLDKLMTIDYPAAKDWNLYYAQSVSLTQFLMSQGTPAQFVKFLKDAQRRGPDAALQGAYQIDGVADLDRRWRDHAALEASRLATVEEGAATAK